MNLTFTTGWKGLRYYTKSRKKFHKCLQCIYVEKIKGMLQVLTVSPIVMLWQYMFKSWEKCGLFSLYSRQLFKNMQKILCSWWEIFVFAEESNATNSVALTANLIFVARDSKTHKAALVNRLSPVTDREILLFKDAEARSKLRKRKSVGERKETDDGIAKRLNELLAEGRIFSDMPALADRNSILLRDTHLENSLICQPQQRNIHGRIFGGFLMHRAFELAFSTAYAFAGLVPCFLEVDHVDFLRPVSAWETSLFKSFNCLYYYFSLW